MKNLNPDPTGTPVYLAEEGKFPSDKFCYVLGADGLMVCRNHLFFKSCAPAKGGPKDLPPFPAVLRPHFPKLPRHLVEQAVGFFAHIYDKHGWESAVLFVWNTKEQRVEMIIPEQKANCTAVHYDVPTLPPELLYLGDMHCHGNWGSKSSFTDEKDEEYRPGMHLIVGYVKREPPEFECVLVADGCRFDYEAAEVMEGYNQRRKDFPKEWLDMVAHKSFSSSYGYWGGGYSSTKPYHESVKEDRAKVKNILDLFRKDDSIPSMEEVRQALFHGTSAITYVECEERAKKFVASLKKERGCCAAAK